MLKISLFNIARAVDGTTAILQTRFTCLKNEARPKLRFGRARLKKSGTDFFSIFLEAMHA